MTEINELVNFLNFIDSNAYRNGGLDYYWKYDNKYGKANQLASYDSLARAFNNRFK